MNDKVKSVLSGILLRFQNGDIPRSIALAQFPFSDIPCSKWSLLNRLLITLSETQDARGFNQWKQVGRNVKKGSKAVHILVPCFKKKEDEEKEYLSGFITCPVFRAEDTEGQTLNYEKIELPELPLLEKAREWGISVKAIPGNKYYYGYFRESRNEIALASPEETVLWHELAHSAQLRLNGKLKRGQDALQEISAELTASALGFIVGKDGTKYLGNHYQYIESYAAKLSLTPHSACLRVVSEVEKLINMILEVSDGN